MRPLKIKSGNGKSILTHLDNMDRKKLAENSRIQKRIVKLLDPDSLLDLEEKLKEVLEVERALLKLSQQTNINPQKLQQVIQDFLDIINLLQI